MRAIWRGLPDKRHDVGWEPGLVVPAADGSPLVTDHYFPRASGDFPTLLVRSPYGRGLPWSPQYGMLFAEQGFHVVLQSCRGTGGSGGAFDLWRNEAADGLATVSWLRGQPWFDGRLGTIGPSYLGYVQWALALDPPPELKAMVVQVGLHDPYALFYADGALRLENALLVGLGMAYQHRGIGPFARATLRLQRRMRDIVTARPLRGAYTSALGDVPWLDDVMTHPDAGDPYWEGASLARAAEGLSVPTSLISGRYDALVDQTFEQYARLRQAGCDTALLLGPWTHTSAMQQGWPEVFAESLAWLRAYLCADPSGLRPTRVRVHVGGADTWQDLDDWPSLSPATTSWFPTAEGGLERRADGGLAGLRGVSGGGSGDGVRFADGVGATVGTGPADLRGPSRVGPGDGAGSAGGVGPAPLASLGYDPGDPTPSLGGALLSRTAGPRDNGVLERREDVLTFTGPPLAEPVDVLGPVSARLSVSTDTGYADVFTRLCDVDAQGRSTNVCDGLVRLETVGQAPSEVTVRMSSTAYRFPAGHRIRWQISAGAHPRYARNPGTGKSPVEAVDFTPIRITLHTGCVLMLPQGPRP
ncbi:CocE/NonD family hydrolase [Streptomyces chartreusis]